MKRKCPWSKLTIDVAIHIDIDGDALVKALQKFVSLGKKLPNTFIALGSHVKELTPTELTQVALSFPKSIPTKTKKR